MFSSALQLMLAFNFLWLKSSVQIYHIWFIPQLIDTWVVSTFLAIRNSAAVNICGKASGYLFSILVYAQEYAESWYFYVQLCQATPNSLPHQCTSLYPNLRCVRVWISSRLCQLVFYLDFSHPHGCKVFISLWVWQLRTAFKQHQEQPCFYL